MYWPSPADYLEVIQNPRICFSDTLLKSCSPELNQLGLPKHASGTFAVVFPVKAGQKRFAVRCFTKYHPDQEQRYEKISKYLQQVKLPFFVQFDFLKEGIKVRNNWYPVVKMEWIEGDSLEVYLKKNIKNPQIIKNLAEQFAALIADLKRCSIAHGDLQHGNILILNGWIRLIDYDGMFVPGLEAKTSHELGHRNYQHPLRSERHFGPYLDNFSALVIYSSLLGMYIDPSLWDRVRGGDDCLLFRHEDFQYPDGSETLYVLDQTSQDGIQSLVSLFRTIPQLDLSKIPTLESVKISFSEISTVTVVSSSQGQVQDTPLFGSSWIWDHIKEPTVIFQNSFTAQRFFIAVAVIAAVVLGYTSAAEPNISSVLLLILLAEAIFVPLILFVHYSSLPQVSAKKGLQREFGTLRKNIQISEKQIKDLEASAHALDQQEAQDLSAIGLRQRDCTQQEKTELDRTELELQPIISAISSRRQTLVKAESSELSQAFLNFRTQELNRQLSRFSLSSTTIDGVGPEMKKRLHLAGVNTAADIISIQISQTTYRNHSNEVARVEISGRGYVHIDGIGPKKARALISWRKELESKFVKSIPLALTPLQESAIRSKYQTQKLTLEKEENKAKADTRSKKDEIRKNFRKKQDALTKELESCRNQVIKQRRELQKRINEEKRLLAPKQWKLGGLKQKLETFRKISFSEYFKHSVFIT